MAANLLPCPLYGRAALRFGPLPPYRINRLVWLICAVCGACTPHQYTGRYPALSRLGTRLPSLAYSIGDYVRLAHSEPFHTGINGIAGRISNLFVCHGVVIYEVTVTPNMRFGGFRARAEDLEPYYP